MRVPDVYRTPGTGPASWPRRLAHELCDRFFVLNEPRRARRIRGLRQPGAGAAALLGRLGGMELTFAVTAGRTGTTYLTRLGELFPDSVSLHEPEPSFVYFLRRAQRQPDLARRYWLEYKLPFIAAQRVSRYIETSHLFCKGFLEPLLALGVRPGVVMLRRHPRPVAASLLARRTVPGRDRLGFKYLVHPGDPGVLPLPDWQSCSDYQLCFWYALEIERRVREYGALLAARGCAQVDVTAEELHDADCFLDVAARLGWLSAVSDRDRLLRGHARLSAQVHNPNTAAPAPLARIDAEEEAVWAAVTPAAPWLRDVVARRYAAPAPVSSRVACRS